MHNPSHARPAAWCGVDAIINGVAAERQVPDPTRHQQTRKFRALKGTVSTLVGDRFTWRPLQLLDNPQTWASTLKRCPVGAGHHAMISVAGPREFLIISVIGAVLSSGLNYEQTGRVVSLEPILVGLDQRA